MGRFHLPRSPSDGSAPANELILLVLWALGMVSSYTAGELVHLLLVIAVTVIVFHRLTRAPLRAATPRAHFGASTDAASTFDSPSDSVSSARGGSAPAGEAEGPERPAPVPEASGPVGR